MRHVLVKWIVLCSLLVGLQARIFVQDPCVVAANLHAESECHVAHDECPPGESNHDGQCPAEHHHHDGICAHATPYAVDEAAPMRLALTAAAGLWLRHEGDAAPDGPCLEADIPPLI